MPVGAALALAAVAVAWRLTLGASTVDDGHSVALALRIARGDRVFGDEMNVQALGSLPVVPFVYAWDHLVGTTGIQLAARVWFVVVAVAVGILAHRALAPSYGRLAAAVGVTAALLGLPYQLPLLSYSADPVLALVLGTASGVALRRSGSTRWSVVLGLACLGGAVSSPQLTPAFGVLLVASLVGLRTRCWAVASGTAIGGGLAVAGWFLASSGWDAIAETIRFTWAYQSELLSPLERLARAVGSYEMVRFPVFWPVWGALALFAIGCARPAWRPLRVGALALAAAWVGGLTVAAASGLIPTLWYGNTVAGLESVLAPLLAVALLVDARLVGAPRAARDLLTALVPALVAAVTIAATTNSGPQYSVHGAAFAGVLAVAAGRFVVVCREAFPRRAAMALGVVPTVALATGLLVLPFEAPNPWHLDTTIRSGPWAGLRVTADRAAQLDRVRQTVSDASADGRSVMLLGLPGGYLAAQGRIDTPLTWLFDLGPHDAHMLAWILRTGRAPDRVVITDRLESQAGGAAAWAARDPLRRWIADWYVVDRHVAGLGTVYRPAE